MSIYAAGRYGTCELSQCLLKIDHNCALGVQGKLWGGYLALSQGWQCKLKLEESFCLANCQKPFLGGVSGSQSQNFEAVWPSVSVGLSQEWE